MSRDSEPDLEPRVDSRKNREVGYGNSGNENA